VGKHRPLTDRPGTDSDRTDRELLLESPFDSLESVAQGFWLMASAEAPQICKTR
jgi:hypothetical protein